VIEVATAESLLRKISFPDVEAAVTLEYTERILRNPEVARWLSKVGYSTRAHYTRDLCYYLKSTGIEDPTALLDLKGQEDPKRRFYPAEDLAETWVIQARQSGFSDSKIKSVIDAVRSFYKHNRVALIQVKAPYRPRAKEDVSDEDLRKFREGFNFYGKILFDFLLSVPLRDGQFTRCKNCGQEFYPRWRHITTYPRIQEYSPFVIWPQKGHENENYRQGLRQVCFLTQTAAKALNLYRELKERDLGRKLRPEEYIFTHQKNILGLKHVTPITRETIGSAFQQSQERTGVKLAPHRLRSWVNTVLATRGIDKQLRDVYLGHSCAYEMGYIMQLIPKWQQTFRQAKAMEHLDIAGSTLNAYDMETLLLQIEDQQKEIAQLKDKLNAQTLSHEDQETLTALLQKFREHKVHIDL
jgi:hypothetical protein